jgi:hypothetical protein
LGEGRHTFLRPAEDHGRRSRPAGLAGGERRGALEIPIARRTTGQAAGIRPPCRLLCRAHPAWNGHKISSCTWFASCADVSCDQRHRVRA